MATIAPPRDAADARQPTERFEALVLDFLAYLELERGLSRNTLDAYRTDLLQYGGFLAERDATPTAPAADIADFLADLATGDGDGRAPASTATVHRKAACLRSFYKHLRRDELIGDDPTARARARRAAAKKLPQVLNYSEVQKLLAAPRGDEPTALRDRALLEVMYACGLRASETIGARASPTSTCERDSCARGQGVEGAARAARRQGDRGDQRLPARRPAEAGRRPPRGASSSSTFAAGR